MAAAVFVLLIPALQNGYPFIFSDTGTYLFRARDLVLEWDRPLPYSIILGASSLGLSPWFSVAFQALLTAGVVAMAFRLLTAVRSPAAATFFLLAAMTSSTAIGLNAGMLMPDVFTPLAFLSLVLIMIAPAQNLTRPGTAFLGAVTILANSVHLSHLVTATLVLFAGVAYRLVASWLHLPSIARRRLLLAGALVVTSWLAVPAVHAVTGNGFRLAPGGPVFLVARMAGNGILADFLREACPHPGWKLCDQQAEIPRSSEEFLWNQTSPFRENGGPKAETLREYGEIFAASIREPRWLGRHVGEAFVATLRQLVLLDPMVAVFPHPAGSYPHSAIVELFPADENNYLAAAQQQDDLGLETWLPGIQRWSITFCLLLVSVILLVPGLRAALHPTHVILAVLVAAGLFANAAACGGLSLPHPRYQARIIVVVPLLLALMLTQRRLWAAAARLARELLAR